MATRRLKPAKQRGPLKTLFLLTSMPVGGAETLLVNLVRRLDRDRFVPEIACLKELGELGEVMSREVTTTSHYLTNKYDLRVLPKLATYFKENEIDAVVIVGAGDKMFWGRLAAKLAGVPVVISALHSTGWPDGVGKLNRLLTRLTDAFVGCADEHGRYLRDDEGFPDEKVHVIPNGVDVKRFRRDITGGTTVRQEFRIPIDAPVCGIVAALRPEKNHDMFLHGAAKIRDKFPDARFIIVGDGPERARLEMLSNSLNIHDCVHFLGTRQDVPTVLAAMNVMLLTSKMEANPVSILEALSTEVPVVATRVGSVPTSVIDNETGFLVTPHDADDLAEKVSNLLSDPAGASKMGKNGRAMVKARWSVDVMVNGYEDLITEIYESKGDKSLSGAEEADRPKATQPQEQDEELANV